MIRAMAALLAALVLAAPARATTTRRTTPSRTAIPALIVPPSASAWDQALADAARRGPGKTAGAVVAMDPWTGRVIMIVKARPTACSTPTSRARCSRSSWA